MWNTIYGSADHIDYPARLKGVLSSLGSSVDIARPGLEILEDEPDRYVNNSQSQNQNLEVPLASSARLQPTFQSRRGVLSRPATPNSEKAQDVLQGHLSAMSVDRAGARRRTLRSKPRHEDSQLEFTVIESSPALAAQASEVLTDHQREVRERQQENAALFPEIRSSPTEKTKKGRLNTAQIQQEAVFRGNPRASTPDNEGDFEDCLTSTPTPRRGQSVMLPEQDQDMTDPPSSPPEPRIHRLLEELKTQANDNSSIDEWQFSSSPVSGSPNVAHTTIAASQPMGIDEVTEELRLDDEDDEGANNDVLGADRTNVSSSQNDVIEETMILEYAEVMALPVLQQGAVHDSPTTPTGRQLRSRLVQITPRSDNEEFVDAPSSPLPPTPSHAIVKKGQHNSFVHRSPRNTTDSQSFAVSASFEHGLRGVGSGRIEIPVRNSEPGSPRKKEHASYKDILPVSPEHAHEGDEEARHEAQEPLQLQEKPGEAMETIEVGGKSSKKSKRGRPRRSKRIQTALGSQPDISSPFSRVVLPPLDTAAASAISDDFENVSPGSGRWWRKRKRSVSSVFSSGGSKKARHYDVLNEDVNLDEVPESQPVDMTNEAVPASPKPTIALGGGVGLQVVEELYDNDVSLVSHLSSEPILLQQRELSQELSASDNSLPIVYEPSATNVTTAVDLQMQDMEDHVDDEEAILSQLTREEEAASAEKELRVSPVVTDAVAPQPLPEPRAEEEEVNEVVAEEQPAGDEPKPSKFDSLMSLLRNGLDTLRSTDLTREQFYQAEDMFFEMRRELLEAERRGHTE